MRRLGIVTLAALVLIVGAQLTRAQETVSRERTELIKEFVEVSGGKQHFNDLMSGMISAEREQFREMLDTLFKNEKSSSRAMLTEMVEQSMDRMSARSREYFETKFDFDAFVSKVFVPAYSKHFTDDELRDMIAFYRTPTGQKVTKKMPELMVDAVAATAKYLLPDYMEFMKRATDEEIAALQKAIPNTTKKPRRN